MTTILIVEDEARIAAFVAKGLRAAGFVFVGPTTMYAMMQAIGMVDDRLEGAAGLLGAGT